MRVRTITNEGKQQWLVRNVTEEFRTAYGGAEFQNIFTVISYLSFLMFVSCWYKYSRSLLIRTLISGSPVILIGLVLWAKFVEISTELTWLKVTGYRIKHSRVLWLIELQISLGRKVQTQVQVHRVNINSRTSNC